MKTQMWFFPKSVTCLNSVHGSLGAPRTQVNTPASTVTAVTRLSSTRNHSNAFGNRSVACFIEDQMFHPVRAGLQLHLRTRGKAFVLMTHSREQKHQRCMILTWGGHTWVDQALLVLGDFNGWLECMKMGSPNFSQDHRPLIFILALFPNSQGFFSLT